MLLRKASTLQMLALKIRQRIGRRGLSIRPDDIFVVSYPRSGNTWLRFLLANMVGFDTGRAIDFFSVREFVPDVHIRDQRQILDELPSPRLIKSHSPYNADYPRVVYLVRDGRDVYPSYYDYLTRKGQFQGSFTEFLQAEKLPYGLWHEHVEGWLDRARSVDLLLVRYEDLLRNTREQLERVALFVGSDTDPARLDYAIERSSLSQMRQLEETKGRPYGSPEAHFVRHGKSRKWVEVFGEADKEIMQDRANAVLGQLGYIDVPEW